MSRKFIPALILFLGAVSADLANAQFRKPGERNTPPAFGERVRTDLKVGDLAPDFTLPATKGKTKVTLSKFKGKKPVVLIFGSYT